MKKILTGLMLIFIPLLASAEATYILNFNSWDYTGRLIGEIADKQCIQKSTWDDSKLTIVDSDNFGNCSGKDKTLYLSLYKKNDDGTKGEYLGQLKFNHWSEGGFIGIGSSWYTQMSIIAPPKTSNDKIIFYTKEADRYRNGAICAGSVACAYPERYKSKSSFSIDVWLDIVSNN